MVYLEFNPRDYEKYWKFAQPNGNLVFRDLDPKLQATMPVSYTHLGFVMSDTQIISLAKERITPELAKQIWNG